MSKNFSCQKMGIQCSFSAKANSEKELMEQVAKHAQNAHKIKMDRDAEQRIKATIWENG